MQMLKRNYFKWLTAAVVLYGQALKYNDSTHRLYVTTLSDKIYRHNKSVNGYGMKIVPSNSLPKSLEWILFL